MAANAVTDDIFMWISAAEVVKLGVAMTIFTHVRAGDVDGYSRGFTFCSCTVMTAKTVINYTDMYISSSKC